MSPARTITARFGLLAVLFQAVLFGWHHHDLAFSGRLPMPVVANPDAPPQAVDDEDGCEICQTLHHQIAAIPDFAARPSAHAIVVGLDAGDAPFIPHSLVCPFHARAPPSL
jgi:hypothetical protein